MSWDAMLEHETRANDPGWAFEAWRDTRIHGHTRYIETSRRTWHAAIAWVVARQGEWDNLTEREAIRELRNPASIFRPLYEAGAGTIWADCPKDGRTVINADGICPDCGYDFDR